MGDPKKKTPSTWGVAKELVSGALTGDYASNEDIVATEERSDQMDPAKVRARAALGIPEPTTAPAPTNASGWADAPMPGVAGDSTAADALDARTGNTVHLERPFESPQAQAFFEKEGYSKAPVGGAALYDEAFIHAPARWEKAQGGLAALHGQRSDALAGFYREQSERDTQAAAASKVQAAEDQQAMQARQAKLDEATQFYTNDLQDQGKFWSNPGNIVSAIAYSLMPIFSNDPAIGVKLINQAIDRDMANRQHAANQTLGALQSNLAGYHKIAGDRQAGNLLAQAEAHRIAAQQVQQIATSFESPISKKQAQLIIEDQKTRQAAAQMEFYKNNVHVNASKMDPALHAAKVLGGPDGYNRGVAPLGGAPQPGASNNETPKTAVQGTLGTTGLPTTAPSGKLSPTAAALANTSLNGISKGHAAGAIPDEQVMEAVRQHVYRQAIAAHEDPNKFFLKAQTEGREAVAKMAPEIAKNAMSRSIITRLQTKMKAIEALESSSNRDPNDFVSYARKSGVPDGILREYDQLTGGDPRMAANKHAELAKWRADAIRNMEQEMAMAINQNIHDLSGGAVNSSEQGRLDKEIGPKMPWRQQMNFLDAKSQALQANVNAVAGGIASPMGQMYYRLGSKGVAGTALPRQGVPTSPSGKYVTAPPLGPDQFGPPR